MDRHIVSSDLLRHGEQFLDASDAAHQTLTQQPRYQGVSPLPTLQLIGGAFEMLFKAFLLERGESLRLMQSLDMDLKRIRHRAMDIGLGHLVAFQGLEEAAIDLLSQHLLGRELAFQRLTARAAPPYSLLRAAAGRLAPAVRQDILARESSRIAHADALAGDL